MKKLILSLYLSAFSCLNIFASSYTLSEVYGPILPIVNAIEQSNASSEISLPSAKTFTMVGIATALVALAIKYPERTKKVIQGAPDFVKNGLETTSAVTTIVSNSIIACTDHIINHTNTVVNQAWNNKKNIAKVTGVTGTALLLNWFIRGENSTISHVRKHGLLGIFPNILSQSKATVSYAAGMFIPVN